MKSSETHGTQGVGRRDKQDVRSKARWLSYAAATGAAAITAGVGEANAVTFQFPGPGSIGANGSVALDLNGDSVNDITIFNLISTSFYGSGGGRAAASGSMLGVYNIDHFLPIHPPGNGTGVRPIQSRIYL